MRAKVFAGVLLMVAAVAAAGAPTVAAAAPDQLRDNAAVTYQLVPARHVIHVTVRLTLTNQKPSTSRTGACTGRAYDPWYGWYTYSTTCTYKTSYYYYSSGVWIEADATGFTAKASSGTVKPTMKKPDGNWRYVTLKYSPLYFGQTRTITYGYDLPASGPRGTTKRIAGAAETSFCAYGPGSDTGEVRITLPAGYVLDTTTLKQTSRSGATWTWSSGRLASKPWLWSSCIDGDNPNGSTTTAVTGTGNPISAISAWSDDPQWAAAANTASGDAAKLETVLGPVPGGDGITLAEATAAKAPYYPYDAAAKRITLAETATDPATFDRAIVRMWFPDSSFGTGWLQAGYVAWAEAGAGIAPACTKPADGAAVQDGSSPQNQTNTACWIVTQVANAIGPERMRATIAAIRDGSAPWPDTNGPTGRTTAISWKDWVDLITAQALLPAHLNPNLAADLMTTYGIAKPADGLADRAKAIAGYLDLQSATGGKAPAFILPAIAKWDFATANAAIDAFNRARTTASSVPTVLAGSNVADGPVQKALAAATSQADLDAAVALADKQVALAKHVADSLAVEAAPRDPLQQIGLIGTTLPSDATAVNGVSAMDEAAANATADQITATIAGAHDAGVTRLAIAVASLVGALLLLLLAVVIVRRRRRPRLVAQAVAVAAGMAPSAAPAELELGQAERAAASGDQATEQTPTQPPVPPAPPQG